MDVWMDGIVFGESPRWHDGRLWFSDWGAGRIWSVTRDEEPVLEAEVEALMCIDFLPDGRLLVVSPADGGVLLRRESDGSLVTHADLSAVTRVGWNDIVADEHGRAYVNSIGFDFPEGEFRPGLVVLVDTRRLRPRGRGGAGLPQRHGHQPGRLDARGRGVLRREADGVPDRRRRVARRAADLGGDTRRPPRRHLLRRVRCALVRRRRQRALRPGARGRRGARHLRLRPGRVRVCSVARGRTAAPRHRAGVGRERLGRTAHRQLVAFEAPEHGDGWP